jgi:hypothetical protein
MGGEVAKEMIKGFEIKKPIRKTGRMPSAAYPDLYVTTVREILFGNKGIPERRQEPTGHKAFDFMVML